MVSGESTWVARGPGYELIARTRRDLGFVQPGVATGIANFRRVFPGDTTTVIATVRPPAIAGQPFVMAPPTPPTYPTAVDLVLPDPKARHDDKAAAGQTPSTDVHLAVARAWLALHAAQITGVPTGGAQRSGEADDARVPAWAEAMIPTLGVDTAYSRALSLVTTHTEELIPLSRYFAMGFPTFVQSAASRGNSRGGEAGGGNRGGMGGGGMGRGGGRGGMRGGGRGAERGGEGEPRGASGVSPRALFDAQSTVLGRYLSRDGYALIASLVDAEIADKPVDDLLAARGLKSVADLESQWRVWIAEQAGPARGR
jgi:hypothetical protein